MYEAQVLHWQRIFRGESAPYQTVEQAFAMMAALGVT
jgi:hypothetical protein